MQKKNMMHSLGLLCCYQGTDGLLSLMEKGIAKYIMRHFAGKDYLLTEALQRMGDGTGQQPNA